jgi:hypothetical protein
MSKDAEQGHDSDLAMEETGEVDLNDAAKRLEEALRQFTQTAGLGPQAHKDRQLSRTVLHEFRQTVKLIRRGIKADQEALAERRQAGMEVGGNLQQWLERGITDRGDVELAIEVTERLARARNASQAHRYWMRLTTFAVIATFVFATISALKGEPLYFGGSGFGLIGSIGGAVLWRKAAHDPVEKPGGTGSTG